MKEDTTKKSPWQSWEDVFREAGIPRKMYVKEVARPITMKEGKEFHFLRGGDTWKLPHYVIEIPDEVLEHKKTISKVLEKHGASKTAIMEAQKVYLGDYLLDLGDNCVFDKFATGCGGTTLALKDDRDCIIAVPSRELVDNKRYYRRKQTMSHLIDSGNGLLKTEFSTYYTQEEREDLFCIYSGLNDRLDSLKSYYNDVMSDPKRRLKIVCTYDQVSKIVGWLLKSLNYNPNSASRPCFLYLDEMQEIYDAYQKSPDDGKDRRESIKKMLEVINTFQHVVVISATIVAERFFFKELLDPNRFKVYHVKFPEGSTERICLHVLGSQYPRTLLVEQLRRYLHDEIRSNAHVFLNSVREILGIIKELGIIENADKFNVVCSTKDDTNVEKFKKAIEQAIRKKYKLGKTESIGDIFQLNEGLADFYKSPIGSTINPPRKINFYTARAFSGCDIFDADAQPYIVTLDPSKVNQVFDVSTKFRQVVGRLRDSKRPPIYIFKPGSFFDEIRTTITANPKADSDTLDIKDEEEVKRTSQNMLDMQAKDKLAASGWNEDFLNRFGLSRDPQTNTIVRDIIIAHQNEMARRSFRDISSVTTISAAAKSENDWGVYAEIIEPKKKKVEDEVPEPPQIEPSEIEVKPRTRTLSFKNDYLAYVKIRQNLDKGIQSTQTWDAEIQFYERKFPYLKEIYKLLTTEEVERTHYSATACQKLIAERNVQNSRSAILEELKQQIPLNTFREQKERKVWTNYFKKKYNLTKFKLSDYGTVKRVMTNKTVIAGEDLFGPIKKVIKIDGFMVTEWLDK